MGKRNSFKAELRQRKEVAARIAAEIRPCVSKDPDWSLAVGEKKFVTCEDYARERGAITRITKQVARAMYPGCAVSVRHGRGTAYNWIEVDVTMPELELEKVHGTPRESEYKDVRSRIESVLLALGIQYATYESDCGPGSSSSPCLLVSVNHIM